MIMNRAYSILEVKGIDDERRIIRGIATTPEPDRAGDIVEPLGVKFKNPMPLLWQHRSDSPVGTVKFDKPTKDGINFEARLPKIEEPGLLKDLVDMAWQSVKAQLVRAVSIGFRAIEYSRIEGGLRFLETEVLELSLVTIPANSEATILEIKSIDAEVLAASGKAQFGGNSSGVTDNKKTPGASGKIHPSISLSPKEATEMKTIAEQIAALEAKRAANTARMTAIMQKATDEGRTTDEAEQTEFDDLDAENGPLEADLKRLRTLEKASLASAKPVKGATAEEGAAARVTGTIIKVTTPTLAKGTAFARYVGAMAAARGNRTEAAEFAKRWKDSTPEVESILRCPVDILAKTAVNPGTTTDTTWAEPLVQYQNMAQEFIDFLRPLSIIGRIQGFRMVPFNIKVPRQTSGAAVNWVGETKVKPLSALAFDQVTLGHRKIAGIIPLSEELVRFSSPSAEALVRDDLAKAITQFMDVEFIDPTNAATDVSPASVTYGLSGTVSTGTTAAAFRLDVKTMFAALLAANKQVSAGYWIMTQQQALSFSLMQNPLGQPEFPGITMMGGTLLGFPVVTSENVPASGGSPTDGYPIIFIMPGEIMMADEGGVSIDMSREASLQMETTPDSPATASTNLVSLWQHNLIAIKAERFINWIARRSTGVALITGAKYAE